MQNPNKPIWFNEDTYLTDTRCLGIIMVCTPVHSECSIHYTQALLKFQQDCLKKDIG